MRRTMRVSCSLAVLLVALRSALGAAEARVQGAAPRALDPLVRTVDLDIGEARDVVLADGSSVRVRLIAVEEKRDAVRQAVREARVRVEVNGTEVAIVSANYRLPVAAGGVQIDCPVTSGYADARGRGNVWAIAKAARFRLWPAGSPWLAPGTFTYPVAQRWFASDTQMANEPVFVDGGEILRAGGVYYHWGLDFGGAEGLVEVVSATDGVVVSAAGTTLPEHADSPATARDDVIYILDGKGWYYRYSHLKRIDVAPGRRVRMGERIGLLGKEGGSGGWSHLHFDITSRQPGGGWGIQDAYAYAWEAWRNENRPPLIAVARPHLFGRVGEEIVLDATRSWSAAGAIARFEWTFTDGTTASGSVVARTYREPGTYSERVDVVDASGAVARDFAVVQVVDPARPDALPPTIHAAAFPTTDVRAGDEVTFTVRTFRTARPGETWDFGDGSPRVTVKSDGNANVHAEDGYAVAVHRYARPGRYIASVEHTGGRGARAVARLAVDVAEKFEPRTRIAIRGGRWHLNGEVTYPGTRAEGLLVNVRMVNAVFEDRRRPDFDPEANTDRFIAKIPEYAAHGVRAFTLCLQGGMPGYEGALNSAFNPDGSLREPYLRRVGRAIEACDRNGCAVILGCFYQWQDQVLAGEAAVRAGLRNAVRWIERRGFTNVVLEIANEFDHGGFDHAVLRTVEGERELIRLAKETVPGLLVSTSGLGHGRYPDALAEAADFLLIHFNGVTLEDIPARVAALVKHGKPIVCNEDDKTGADAARAAGLCIGAGASWGLMLKDVNQYFPLRFEGAADDPVVYRKLAELTSK